MVTTTFCISGAVLKKAGANVSSVILNPTTFMIGSDYGIDLYIAEAESVINVNCRYNFTDKYAVLNDDVKRILSETAANLAAISAITYDMGNYNSRTEAEDMINTLRDVANRNMAILRDKKQQDFINGS